MDALDIPYTLNPHLVRGLDYYTRTVFEFVIQETTPEPRRIEVGGGGRYDYLAKVLANKDVPAVGGAIGIDRISEILIEKEVNFQRKEDLPKVFLIQLGDYAKRKSLSLMEEFRKANIPLAQSISKDSLRGQLKIAAKLEVLFSLIMGQKEAMDDTIIIRDMDSGAQETLPFHRVIERIKNKLNPPPPPTPTEA